MANLAQTAVVTNDFWKEGGASGRKFKAVDATLTLTGQGGLTNKILTSLFGLVTVKSVRSARKSDSTLILAAPSYDESCVVLGSTNGAGTPTDWTATIRLVVVGYE